MYHPTLPNTTMNNLHYPTPYILCGMAACLNQLSTILLQLAEWPSSLATRQQQLLTLPILVLWHYNALPYITLHYPRLPSTTLHTLHYHAHHELPCTTMNYPALPWTTLWYHALKLYQTLWRLCQIMSCCCLLGIVRLLWRIAIGPRTGMVTLLGGIICGSYRSLLLVT